jgi:hypothetical protein
MPSPSRIFVAGIGSGSLSTAFTRRRLQLCVRSAPALWSCLHVPMSLGHASQRGQMPGTLPTASQGLRPCLPSGLWRGVHISVRSAIGRSQCQAQVWPYRYLGGLLEVKAAAKHRVPGQGREDCTRLRTYGYCGLLRQRKYSHVQMPGHLQPPLPQVSPYLPG